MRWGFFCLWLLMPGGVWANADLLGAIDNVHVACGALSDELAHLKTMAGINTAVTSVGTVAGGVALGTGLAKVNVDKQFSEYQELIDTLESVGAIQVDNLDMFYTTFSDSLSEINTSDAQNLAQQLRNRKNKLEQKSKNLGDWRTGTMAVSMATNIAGAVIAGGNKVKGDLKAQIAECVTVVKTLSDVRMQAYVAKTADDVQMGRAENIIRACGAWEFVDVDAVNKKSSGASVSSGVGAGLGLIGTVTSAMANSDKLRSGDADKEKNLNAASNILAGGTTVASGVATVFNATQIAAIKRIDAVADECEEVLK